MRRYFGLSAVLTIISVLVILFGLGLAAALTTVVLIAIEVAFSFDNAVVNAKVLEKLSPVWRQLFLTVGIVVAIIGMRLLFPLLIVVFSAHLSIGEVIREALHHPALYSQHVAGAQVAIDAFGGGFLMTLALYFLLDDERQDLWLERIEGTLQRLGGRFWLPPAFVIVLMIIISSFNQHSGQVLRLGVIGALSYALLKLAIDLMAKLEPAGQKHYAGRAALGAFIYLQVLDAAFSFDSVLGAFAISDKIILIAVGLGVGAIWVRSLTVYLVERATLKSYVYLEHGAHYAILALAIALLTSLFFNVPDAVSGLAGLGIIAASFYTSRQVLTKKV